MMQEYFLLALKNIRRRKLRSWLTMVGIFVSIAIIFVLISLSIGLQNAITEQVRSLGSDKIYIYPLLSAGIPGVSNPIKMTNEDYDVISKVNGVKTSTYAVIDNGAIKFSGKTGYFIILGLPLDKSSREIFLESVGLKMDEGKFPYENDRGTIVLGSQFKYGGLFEKPIKTGDNIEVSGHSFKVSGILKTLGNSQDDSQAYIGIDDSDEFFNSTNRVDEIIVQVQQGVDVHEVATRIEKKLLDFRGLTENTKDFEVVTPEELLKSVGTVLNIITAFLLGVAAISLIVGSVGIANTMYTSVLERRKEVGIMKAVGARNQDVMLLFLMESGLLGLVGGILGVILGILMGKAVQYIAVHQLNTSLLQSPIPPFLVFGCLAFAFVVGAVSGAFPAWQASQIRPVQALRYE